MPSTLTAEELQKRISFVENKNIKIISKVKTIKGIIKVKCGNLTCDNIWESSLERLYNQKTNVCRQCSFTKGSSKRILPESEIKIRLTKLNIKLLSNFTKCKDKHKLLCLVPNCNNIWEANLSNIFNNKGCPKCGIRKSASAKKLNQEIIESRIKELRKRNIQLISPFTKMKDKHTFKCLLDGFEWRTSFDTVWREDGCPKCRGYHKTEEEKMRVKAHAIVRNALAKLYIKGKTVTKVYKNEDGGYNEILSYGSNQVAIFMKRHPKPLIGDWQLDHIIPVSWFDPYDINQLKLCWHHNNFQWLTASENASKNNRVRPIDVKQCFTDWHYQTITKCSYAKPLPTCV